MKRPNRMTKKEQELLRINDILTARKQEIRSGTQFTAQEFAAFFGSFVDTATASYKNAHRERMRLVALQANVNSLLQESGLYISSRDYYSVFYVRDLNQVKTTVKRISAKADAKAEQAAHMVQRAEARLATKNYGTHNRVTTSRIKAIISGIPPTDRHSQILQRISLI